MPTIHDYFDIAPESLVELEDGTKEAVPSKAVLRCYGCYEYGNKDIKRCACKCTYFCGVDCQRKSWTRHKQECAPIKAHARDEQKELQEKLDLATQLMDTSNNQQQQDNESFTCAVCLDDKRGQETTTTTVATLKLYCGHAFCYDCIKEVQYSAFDKGFVGREQDNCIGLCPLCRTPVPMLDAFVASRVQALLVLAETHVNDQQERDRVGQLALENLDFVLQKEAGATIPRQMQGEVYLLMEQYDQAIDSFKRTFNAFRLPLADYLKNGSPTLKTKEQYEARMEQARATLRTLPGTDFPSDQELETTLMELIQVGMQTGTDCLQFITNLFLLLAKAYLMLGGQQVMSAFKLLLVLQKLNQPLAKQFNGCRPVDMALKKTLAECYIYLGKVDTAKHILEKMISKFRYQPGLHKLMAECERKEGNLNRALFYATKGYFYEEVWNEQVTRAKNLHLWNEIRKELDK